MRCAVLGSPIAHSLSPALHRVAYLELGLDWTYDAIEVDEAGLADFISGCGPEWRGLSLTMPLKRTVMPLLDQTRPRAEQAGAANTVLFDDGAVIGDNTDVGGAIVALQRRLHLPDEPEPHEGLAPDDGGLTDAVILGGGATATSVGLAAAELGATRITLVVRDPQRAQAAADVLSAVAEVEVVTMAASPRATDLLIATVPAEVQSDLREWVDGAAAVFDVVYDPWPTPFMSAADRAGVTCITGKDLLLHQAALQVELMTGRPAPLRAMAAALLE